MCLLTNTKNVPMNFLFNPLGGLYPQTFGIWGGGIQYSNKVLAPVLLEAHFVIKLKLLNNFNKNLQIRAFAK